MKTQTRLTANLLVLLVATAAPTATADLPELDKPWFGMFAVYEGRASQIVINKGGELIISPHVKNGHVGPYRNLPVTFGVEEILPNGRSRVVEILPDSLESSDPATDEFEKTVIRGKVEGDAAFELTIEHKRGVVSIGGRVTDPGTLTKNPIRFRASALIRNFYGRSKLELKNDVKAFEELVSDDYVKLKWIDGKRQKFDLLEPVDAAAEEVNGPGSEEVETELGILGPRKFVFTAAENSSLRLSNRKKAPLHSGYYVNWVGDPEKDPKGEARLTIEVK